MYQAAENRYLEMKYNRCGKSGLLLPQISLGLWQNFGLEKPLDQQKEIITCAFDHGITHFDLANNYGRPAEGMAEKNFGRILHEELSAYRDEMVISTKAGYDMWPGPYGNWGSRKYLMASLDQSLKRMNLDYVDIFYHHRPDPETPLEETMGALSDIVRQGKALYVGISNYQAEEAKKAIEILRNNGTPCLIHQPRYNMFERWVENGLLDVLQEEGVGYLSEEHLEQIRKLNEIAKNRGQTLAQMALWWILRRPEVTTVLVGASSSKQLLANLGALKGTPFTEEELGQIEKILGNAKVILR